LLIPSPIKRFNVPREGGTEGGSPIQPGTPAAMTNSQEQLPSFEVHVEGRKIGRIQGVEVVQDIIVGEEREEVYN